MLTMINFENPMDFVKVENIENCKKIKEIIQDYIKSDKAEKDLSDAVSKLGWINGVDFDYMNQTRNLKVKWNVKNKDSRFKFFSESVIIVDMHKEDRIKFSIVFKTDAEEQTFKFIKLKESNNQQEFLRKVYSNEDFETIKATGLNVSKLEQALCQMESVGNAKNIAFSIDEIIPCDKLDKKGVGISYYPGKVSKENNEWTFGFYLNEGFYLEKFNIMFKGGVFERGERSRDWFLKRVDFHPVDKDLPIGISSFTYESLSNGAKMTQGPSMSIIIGENSSVVFRYRIKNVFDVELVEMNYSKSLCLFGFKESMYLRGKNNFSIKEAIKGETISEDLKVQLFYNYLCSVYNEETIIKELFLQMLNGEVSEKDFLFLLEVNIGISHKDMADVAAKINEINKLLSLIPDDGDLSFVEFLKIKEDFEDAG